MAQTIGTRAPWQQSDPLPRSHWRLFERVRRPGGDDLVDQVVVGPSGVYVVLRRGGGTLTDAPLHAQVAEARVGAEALRPLLPARHQQALRPAVVLESNGEPEVAEDCDGVLVASPATLLHIMRHTTRVLSTGEVTRLADLLESRLELVPLPPAPARRRSRKRLVLVAAAVSSAVAAAAVAVEQVVQHLH